MIARSLAYEMWPKSACDFLAPLLHPRNRRLAGGYFGSKETNIVLDRIESAAAFPSLFEGVEAENKSI